MKSALAVAKARAEGRAEPRKENWRTPKWLFRRLHALVRFEVDAAADADNALLPEFWSESNSALEKDWRGRRIFCNPPYNQPLLTDFVEKACEQTFTGVLLVPAKMEQPFMHVLLSEERDDRCSLVYAPFRLAFENVGAVAVSGNVCGSVLACFGEARGLFDAHDVMIWRGASNA